MPTKSTRSRVSGKPYRPPGCPLFPHGTGRWAVKFRKRIYYFGRWGNQLKGEIVPVANVDASLADALEEYERQRPFLLRGEAPPAAEPQTDEKTVHDAVDEFLKSKRDRMETGELSAHTFAKYYETCELMLRHFGMGDASRTLASLTPQDFRAFRRALANGCGFVTLKSKINRCRVVFNYATENGMVGRIEFGSEFDWPSDTMLRKERNAAGEKMFEADELRRVLDALDGKPVAVKGKDDPVTLTGSAVLKAMVLLGINCGFGNTDVATLPQSALVLDRGWISFPRPKTQVSRVVPLWPETVEALRAAIAVRPAPNDPADADLCFITAQGNRFVRVQSSRTTKGKHVTINAVARRFDALIRTLGVNGRRGLGFYALRHTFETIAGESRDQVAVDAIMGHVDSSMAASYRERISDDRLQAVVEHVRGWLFGTQETS